MPRRFHDLLIVPSSDWAVDDNELISHPPAVGGLDTDPSCIEVGGGVTLEFIPDHKAIMTACEPRGENFSPVRQYGQRYTFARRNAPGPAGHWDPDGALYACVALSRLVRANAADSQYAARIEEADGSAREVQPVDGGFRTWVAREDQRPWLDAADVAGLTVLHESYLAVQGQLNDRVSNALWFCDYGFRIQYVDMAIPHYVTCLEALLNTDDRGSGRQFYERVPQLAAAVGVGLDEAFCKATWKQRSKAAHGARVKLSDDSGAAEDLDRLQAVARLSVRRSIEDPAFHDYFANRATVRTRFPVSAPDPGFLRRTVRAMQSAWRSWTPQGR
jgi:hypothetical protein